eukprot:2829280-Rhodomonas_salina.1
MEIQVASKSTALLGLLYQASPLSSAPLLVPRVLAHCSRVQNVSIVLKRVRNVSIVLKRVRNVSIVLKRVQNVSIVVKTVGHAPPQVGIAS